MAKVKDRQLVSAAVVSCIKTGMLIKQACMAAGIAQRTFMEWKQKDPQLAATVKKAECDFERFHLENIAKHSKQDWKASAWLLERKYPERYAKREAPEVKVRQSVEVTQPAVAISVADLQEAATILDGLGFKPNGQTIETTATPSTPAEPG